MGGLSLHTSKTKLSTTPSRAFIPPTYHHNHQFNILLKYQGETGLMMVAVGFRSCQLSNAIQGHPRFDSRHWNREKFLAWNEMQGMVTQPIHFRFFSKILVLLEVNLFI